MQLKRILKAVLKIRNIALLAGVVIVTYLTGYLPFALAGAAAYLFFLLQTLNDKALDRNNEEMEVIDHLLDLDSQCGDLYEEARKMLDKQALKKVDIMLREKNELMELFQNDQDDYVKQKVTEQVLKLSMAYINLISEYVQRRDDLAAYNTDEIMEGINAKGRKLKSLRDAQAIEDMKNAIEMDQKILERIGQEKKELEKMSARLTYIESTLKTFNHQVKLSENTDGISTEAENIIKEASALDSALSSRKDRLKL